MPPVAATLNLSNMPVTSHIHKAGNTWAIGNENRSAQKGPDIMHVLLQLVSVLF